MPEGGPGFASGNEEGSSRRENRREPALWDVTGGQRWTFGDLAAATERGPRATDPIAFPRGISGQFILEVAQAWRAGQVVCPLEAGPTPPRLSRVPEGCVHLKMTSATTGAARMIGLTAGQLAADAENIVATMGLRRDWANLGVISLAHSYGFSSLVTPLLLQGIPLLLADSPLPEAVRRA